MDGSVPGVDGSVPPSDGATGDSGGSGASCTGFGNALCAEMATCDPTGLALAYGDVATCQSIVATGCAAAAIPDETGLTDPAACLAAYTASCTSYFETLRHAPAACLAKPGTIADQDDGCGYDPQCVAGDVCDFSNASDDIPACMKGTCIQAVPATGSCTVQSDCDFTKAGQSCVPTASGTPLTSDGNLVCQAITYGGSGAGCLAGTNLQCQAAFYCSANDTCVPKLTVGQPCTASDGSCDDRTHLACVIPTGGTVSACTAPNVVPSGAACGGTTGNICQGNLYCDTSATTPTCKPRVASGGGCVASVAGECTFGLVCGASTSVCGPPPALVCP